MRPSHHIAALVTAALIAGGSASSIHAQNGDISRRVYAMYDTRLDIDVLATSPGQLQVMRGGEGRVEVAAHATKGVAAFGLATENGSTLRLTALGALQSDYVVIVPERTSVRVRLPGRTGWSEVGWNPMSRFRWDSVPEPYQPSYDVPRPTIDDRYYVVRSSADAPARLRVSSAAHIQSLQIRLEGTEFRLASNRALSTVPGSAEVVDVDPGTTDVDLMIQLPAYTRDFDLSLDGKSLLTIVNGVISDYCRPGIRQTTSAGKGRFDYRPASGITCGQ